MIPAATEGVEWATVGPLAIVVGVVVVGAALLLSLFVRRGERPAGPELQVLGPEEAEAPPAAPPPTEPPPRVAPTAPPPPAPSPVAPPPAVPDGALSALDEDIDELAARLRRLGGGGRDES